MLEEDCIDCSPLSKGGREISPKSWSISPESWIELAIPAQVRDSSLEVIRITVKQSLMAYGTHPGEQCLAVCEIRFPSLGELIRVTEPQI